MRSTSHASRTGNRLPSVVAVDTATLIDAADVRGSARSIRPIEPRFEAGQRCGPRHRSVRPNANQWNTTVVRASSGNGVNTERWFGVDGDNVATPVTAVQHHRHPCIRIVPLVRVTCRYGPAPRRSLGSAAQHDDDRGWRDRDSAGAGPGVRPLPARPTWPVRSRPRGPAGHRRRRPDRLRRARLPGRLAAGGRRAGRGQCRQRRAPLRVQGGPPARRPRGSGRGQRGRAARSSSVAASSSAVCGSWCAPTPASAT